MAVFPSSPSFTASNPQSPSTLTRRPAKSPAIGSAPASDESGAILRSLEQTLTQGASPSNPTIPTPTLRQRCSTFLLSLGARLVAGLFPSVQYVALPSDTLPPPNTPIPIFLYGQSYDISTFIPHHPGGSIILQSVVNTDCTDFFASNHPKLLVQQARDIAEGLPPRGVLKSLHRGVAPAVGEAGVGAGVGVGGRSAMQEEWDGIVGKLEEEGKFSPTLLFYLGKAVVQAALLATVVFLILYANRYLTPRTAPLSPSTLSSNGTFILSDLSPPPTWLLSSLSPPSSLLSVVSFLTPSVPFLLYTASALLLGLFWQQMAFLGHDAGHNQITGSARTDYYYAWIVTALFGVSGDWWKRNHNVHHVHTNSIECDPDIQHLPMLAISGEVLKGFWSSFYQKKFTFDGAADAMVQYQHLLYYPLMSIARANLYVQSWLLCLNPKVKVPHRKWELIALACYWCWFILLMRTLPSSHLLRWWYYMVSHAVAGLVHVQITLSHFAMPAYHGPTMPAVLPISTTTHDEHSVHSPEASKSGAGGEVRNLLFNAADVFFFTQFSTTMNVTCPRWLDWFHGGLQFQVEHHLLPRLPRMHLRYAMERYVRPFAKKHRLPYHAYSFKEANRLVYEQLKMQAMNARAGVGGGARGDEEGERDMPLLWQGMMARG